MRRILTTMISILIIGTIWAKTPPELVFKKGKNQLKTEKIRKEGFEFNLSIAKAYLKEANKKEGSFYYLQTESFTQSTSIGKPSLPSKGKLIKVPLNAKVKVNILSSEFQIVNLNEKGFDGMIMPCQPSVSKCADGEKIAFEMNKKTYETNQFYFEELVKYEESGIMRGTRLGRIEINPFQYNPVTNQLKVYTTLQVEVLFENADYDKTNKIRSIYDNILFDNVLSKTLNFTSDSKALNQNEPLKMIIIADRMFETTLAPFVEWKKMTGIETIVRYTDEAEVGNTTTSIKGYLKGVYDAATNNDPAPSFVLLVGDVQQIPPFDGTADSHVSDLYYFTYDGASDLIPDVNYGRFSAQNVTHLENIINKTLLYEKYEMEDPSYLSKALLVAGVDDSFAMVYGNGAINYASIYLNEENGINVNKYYYPESGSSVSQIIQNINEGVAIGNYSAHCSPAGWADPAFQTSDIPSLTNKEKLGLLIGNCCQSNTFNNNECFGEALLRTADKGAIGYIGGSNSTYWDEDYYWACGYGNPIQEPTYENFGNGAYDLMLHKNIEDQPYEVWAPTQSQINLAGLLAVEESNSVRKTYYWEIYHLMGDPTLMPWIGIPDAMEPSYFASIPIGVESLKVENLPEYARVTLSENGIIYASGLADEDGIANLEFSTFTSPKSINLVVTAQFKQPFIGKLEIIPNNQPYILYDSHLISDGAQGNGQLDYGEESSLSISIKNVGKIGAKEVELKITTEDLYTTIIDGTETINKVDGETKYTLDKAFKIKVADNIPDDYAIPFNLEVKDNSGDSWISKFTVKANAPKFEITKMLIKNENNENGRIYPGDEAEIIFTVNNVGHSKATNTVGALMANSPFFTIMNPEEFKNINAEDSIQYIFKVKTNDKTPNGTNINLNLKVSKKDYADSTMETIMIGNPTNITIGDDNENVKKYPFNTYYKSNCTQILYLGSEIGQGELIIKEIAFDFVKIDDKVSTVKNFKINIKETSINEFGDAYADMTNATTVIDSDTYDLPQSTGFQKFDIENYKFDASKNLIIEIMWGVNDKCSDFQSRYITNNTETDFKSVAYGLDDKRYPAKFDNNSSLRPNIILYTEEVVSGDIYAANFTITDGTNPIENASVMIGSLKKPVDANGKTSFNLYEGTYYYSVYADEYQPIINEMIVIEKTVDKNIVLNVGINSTAFNNLKLYPNPTNGNITIELPNIIPEANVTIYDLTGKIVKSLVIKSSKTIDLSQVSKGIYFVKINADRNNITKKIIIN